MRGGAAWTGGAAAVEKADRHLEERCGVEERWRARRRREEARGELRRREMERSGGETRTWRESGGGSAWKRRRIGAPTFGVRLRADRHPSNGWRGVAQLCTGPQLVGVGTPVFWGSPPPL